jgi:hypothetical protein
MKSLFLIPFFTLTLLVAPVALAVDTSSNWAGYAVQGGTYTGVSGTFVMPELSYSSTLVSNATWIGIGGRSSADLIQAGVYEVADASGATYQAWYELLPDNAVPIDLPVHPNDSISIALLETSNDTWNIVITNNTTKQQFAKTVQYHSSRSSAEWIQERPQINGALPPLAGFTPVVFTNAYAIQDGQRLPLNQMHPFTMTMLDTGSNVALAVPSIVGADNISFNVFRTSAVASIVPAQPSHIPTYLLHRTGHDIFPFIPIGWTIQFQNQ